jgi:ParB family chromosome partitioning protein
VDFHPIANIFPLMTDEEYRALVADISEHGQREAIWTYCGQIIDGRNRYRACAELGLKPIMREWDGDGSLVAFVLSMNLHRRHLSSSQKAVVALDVLPMLEAEARERMKAGAVATNTGSQKIDYPDERQGKATEQAATLTGTNRQYVSDAKQIAQRAPDLLDDVRNGIMSIPQAKQELVAREQPPAPAVYQPMAATVYSFRSVEYYTPPEILNAARAVLGDIDLDPASCEDAQQNVMAHRYYTQHDDGLTKTWRGRVWLNPPYGKTNGRSNQDIWAQRLVAEYQEGNISAAILLVKAALGYKWFEELFREWPVCFARDRLSFILETGDDDGQSKQGTALFYFGPNPQKFYRIFSAIGRVIPPENAIDETVFG